MSIFSKFEAIAEGIAHSAHGLLVQLFGQPALDAVEADLKTIFSEDVLTIFQDAITAAESLKQPEGGVPASNADKRSAAFLQIAQDLKTKGIALAEHTINLGIELVVGLVKAKTPVAAAAPSAPAATTA
jgi:hypothetical protein